MFVFRSCFIAFIAICAAVPGSFIAAFHANADTYWEAVARQEKLREEREAKEDARIKREAQEEYERNEAERRKEEEAAREHNAQWEAQQKLEQERARQREAQEQKERAARLAAQAEKARQYAAEQEKENALATLLFPEEIALKSGACVNDDEDGVLFTFIPADFLAKTFPDAYKTTGSKVKYVFVSLFPKTQTLYFSDIVSETEARDEDNKNIISTDYTVNNAGLITNSHYQTIEITHNLAADNGNLTFSKGFFSSEEFDECAFGAHTANTIFHTLVEPVIDKAVKDASKAN